MQRAQARGRAAGLAIFALGVFALGGCATPPEPEMRWERPGATEAQLEADQRICLNQAAGTSSSNRRFDHVARGSAFMRCMNERGWRQVPADS